MYFLWHRLIPGRKLFALTGTFFFHFFKVVKRWSGRFHLFNRRRFNDRRGNILRAACAPTAASRGCGPAR